MGVIVGYDFLRLARCCCCCCCVCVYPATFWWEEVLAFIPDNPAKAAVYQPDSFAFIKGKQYQPASIPTDGSQDCGGYQQDTSRQ